MIASAGAAFATQDKEVDLHCAGCCGVFGVQVNPAGVTEFDAVVTKKPSGRILANADIEVLIATATPLNK